jgi:hypothetical protein
MQTEIIEIDESNEKHPILPSPQSHSEEIKLQPQRNRRKNLTQSKLLQNPSSSSTSPSVPMILNLIDSLVDEKQFDNNDENLLLTIDHLINNLKHLREKIKTINHDDTHPLNLSKPKIKQHNHNHMNAPTTSTNFTLPTPIFPSQPFLPPFSRKYFSIKRNFYLEIISFLVANMAHLQNYLKLSAASVLNDSMV